MIFWGVLLAKLLVAQRGSGYSPKKKRMIRMSIPNYDNAMQWKKEIRTYWKAASWRKRLLLVIILIIIFLGSMFWWFIRSKSNTGDVAGRELDPRGSHVKSQYTAGRDMSVYNIGNVQQLVIGAQPEDIENLHRLATAHIFKVINDQLKNEIHNNLAKVQQKFISSLPRIIISADKGIIVFE